MSPRTHHILFVTKSLEPSNHFSTITQDSGSLCCRLLLGNYCTYQSQLCVNKYVSQALSQMLQTTKMKYGKLLSLPRLTIGIPSQSSALDSLSTVKHSNFQIILAHHEVFGIMSVVKRPEPAQLCLHLKNKTVALRVKRSITEGC